MNKYLSLIFLYNRASHKKILLLLAVIPLSFLAVFLLRIGNPAQAEGELLMERGFGGFWAVAVFIAVNISGVMAVAGALNSRKDLKATHATTGYTMRRLAISPIASFLTIFVYYLAVIVIFWGAAALSLYAVGKIGLTMAGVTEVNTKLALGLLRTEIGHALLPIAHPAAMAFNIAAILALAVECAKSSYLTWHNGTPAAGVILIAAAMFLVWMSFLDDSYMFMATVVLVLFGGFSFGDVIFREKRPKGDPFKANKYAGIMDMDSFEFDDSVYIARANSLAEAYSPSSDKKSFEQVYSSLSEKDGKKKRRLNPFWLRRRFMPPGINMEKAGGLFGVCLFAGAAQHMIFLFRFISSLYEIEENIKGMTIAHGVRMPYFWDLESHTYYGYLAAAFIVFLMQAYWNWEYYNKKTKSVYVMKRLPDRKEYSRTIWAAPALQSCFIIVFMLLHTAFDLGIYLAITPDVAFYPDYLSRILPF